MKLLEVENLTVQYPGSANPACKVSFQVESGELLGIAGASGAGKSTAMLALMGILPEQVQITSEKLKQHGTKAMIFQDASASLNPLVRVGKQLTETILAHQRCTGKEARERAETLLDEVGIQDPGQRMKQYPFELSGGMKQRVAIAIALACNPDLIIADEPTTALDVTVQRQILDLLKKIAEETHTAIVLVSHDLGVIASMCSRVLVMKEGRIVEEGSMEQIFYEPAHPYTKKLSDMARKLYQVPEKKKTGEVILRTQGLGRSFVKNSLFGKSRSLEAVEPLSFEIHKGETFGLVGESGSGKTTLARMLTGIIPPSCGSFSCEGKIQMIFQEASASFDPEFSLERILEEPLVIQKKGSKKEREKRVAEMLGLVQMEKIDVRKTTAALSGGQRQRIAVARALLLNPELLICDESFSSQDILTQSRLLELLEKAETLDEIIQLEDRISNVRYEIESLTSQMKIYDKEVAYSTVSIFLEDVTEYSAKSSFGSRTWEAFTGGWNSFVSTVQSVIVALIWFLPFLVVGGAVVIIVVVCVKRSGRKKRAKFLADTENIAPEYVPTAGQNSNNQPEPPKKS